MAKDKKSFVAYSDEGKKIWDDIVNMKWQIHHYYGQSYLSNEEIAKQKDNICTLRRLKEITIDERLLINELLRQGRKHQLELKEYLYNTPRREAQAFIGKKEVRDTIFNLHGKSCLRCGSLDNISLDHVIPIYHNGENTIDNLQPLCRSCNSSKGTKIIDYRKGGKQNETN